MTLIHQQLCQLQCMTYMSSNIAVFNALHNFSASRMLTSNRNVSVQQLNSLWCCLPVNTTELPLHEAAEHWLVRFTPCGQDNARVMGYMGLPTMHV